jgi:hypothetical protein
VLKLPVLLTGSFVLAASGLAPWIIPYLGGNQFWADRALVWSAFVAAPAWVVLASFCFWRHGKRGLWVLVSAPAALASTVFLLLILASCVTGHGCL